MLDEGVLYMMCLEILVRLCGGLPTEPDSLYAGYSGCLYCSVYEEGHRQGYITQGIRLLASTTSETR